MRFRRRKQASVSGRRILPAALAILLPVALLAGIQYYYLSELEAKTAVAARDSLRQALKGLAVRAEERMAQLGRETMARLDDLWRAGKREQAKRFLDRRAEAHPEVRSVFLQTYCQSSGSPSAALAYTRKGLRLGQDLRKLGLGDGSRLKGFYERASASSALLGQSDVFFFQQPRCTRKKAACRDFFLFAPAHDREGQEIGFVGMQLDSNWLQSKWLPKLLCESSPVSGGSLDDRLVLSAYSQGGSLLAAYPRGQSGREVEMAFAPVFPHWRLAAGYAHSSVEDLARSSFARNLAFGFVALSLVLIGSVLTLRAAVRESRLAAAQSSFVSNVSHELKTPVALIRLFAETLELGRVKSPRRERDYHRIINRESTRLTHLIDNILDFSRIEARRKQYNMRPASLRRTVEQVLASYRYHMEQAHFRLHADLDRGLPLLPLDSDAVAQALLNLLDNAVKYSGQARLIEIKLFRKGDEARLQVADSGIGVPRSERKRIFEKFYRVGDALVHDTKGSGLGLTLVQHIMQAHGGRVTVEGRRSGGSRFCLHFPLTDRESKK